MKIQILEVHLKSIDQGEGSEWCNRMFKEIGSHLKWCKDEVYDVRSMDTNKVESITRRPEEDQKKRKKMIAKGVQL